MLLLNIWIFQILQEKIKEKDLGFSSAFLFFFNISFSFLYLFALRFISEPYNFQPTILISLFIQNITVVIKNINKNWF